MRFRLAVAKGAGWLMLALAFSQWSGRGFAAEANQDGARRGFLQRAHPMMVERGMLTVNGLPVKTGMSFRIADLHFLFIDVPGTGSTVISDRPFAGAREQKRAFKGSMLTVMSGGNRLELTSSNRLHGTHSAYVRLDRDSRSASRTPEIGYASSGAAPVVWIQDAGGVRVHRRRVAVRTRRALREAKLCRPSARGREACAIIREVRYHE